MAEAAFSGTLGGILAGESLSGPIEALIGDTISVLAQRGRYSMALSQNWMQTTTAEFLDHFGPNSGDTSDPVLGVTPAAIVDAFASAGNAALSGGSQFGSQLASMMYMTPFVFSFTGALEVSIAQSFRTINAVYRGATGMSVPDIDTLVTKDFDIDEKSTALLMAMAGANIPTTMLHLLLGYGSQVGREMGEVRTIMYHLQLDAINSVLAFHSKLLSTAETMLTETINAPIQANEIVGSLIAAQAEKAAASIEALVVEDVTVEAELALGLVQQDEVDTVELENLAEAQATQSTYNDLKKYWEDALDTYIYPDFVPAVNTWETALKAYVDMLTAAKNSVNTWNPMDILQPYLTAFDDMLVYRANINGTANILTDPFKVSIVGHATTPSTITVTDSLDITDSVTVVHGSTTIVTVTDFIRITDSVNAVSTNTKVKTVTDHLSISDSTNVQNVLIQGTAFLSAAFYSAAFL